MVPRLWTTMLYLIKSIRAAGETEGGKVLHLIELRAATIVLLRMATLYWDGGS